MLSSVASGAISYATKKIVLLVDIVTGESVDAKRIQIWENRGNLSFTPHAVNKGNSEQTHIGCLPADMDNDGDVDLVNISYSCKGCVFIWRNDADPPTGARRAARPSVGLSVARPRGRLPMLDLAGRLFGTSGVAAFLWVDRYGVRPVLPRVSDSATEE